ncbi:replication initiator protein A [Deinococcus ruber]|uniref:Plasmid replication initiator protein n=1 Tax=Deinococcus ruber TaxID=1848197 RepID=A0A918CNZ1_9DEIO|nr:replication initiator protein A [Deinococcus ruber]GGR32770.1 hypothetical protein GCM10008957_49030 [Deinococcus ruber]
MPVTKVSPVKGSDERNFSSLILIPSQERLPKDRTRLERFVTRSDGQVVKVVAEGLDLAHGIDNDILVGLVNLYIEAGCPTDGVIEVSAYSVLKMAGLPTEAHYYKGLEPGMKRLKGTVFTITEGWFEHKKKSYLSMSFNIIDNYNRTHDVQGLTERSHLRIKLNEHIVRSINAGYLKPLDLTLYRQLPSVGSRTLYRLLDAHLHEAIERGEKLPFVMMLPLESLAAACGLLDDRSGNLKRNIERMHQPLLDTGYLKSAEFIGRGKQTTLRYSYAADIRTADSEQVILLTNQGVSRGVAEKYAQELGNDIQAVLESFHARMENGPKIQNPAGYLVKLLKESASVIEQARLRQLNLKEATQKKAEQEESRRKQEKVLDDQRQQVLLESPPPQAAELLLNKFTVKRLLSKGVTQMEIDQLRQKVERGEIDSVNISKLLTQAMINNEALEALHLLV